MDFLQSLNVDDLPEQQTRTSRLEEQHPNFELKLGIDSCCTCGKSSPTVSCNKCHRIMYCSNECRRQDSDSSYDDRGNDQAMGHSSVICALLALCNDDEVVEEGDEKEIASLSEDRKCAAEERVASEYESYPATLANSISDIPCFQSTLQRCRANKSLTIHVVGASEESELWGKHPNPKQKRNVWQSHADALAEVAENFHINISIEFVGPDCPKETVEKVITIPPVQAKKSFSSLHVTTSRKKYEFSKKSPPDILIFFNPGFTCPEYNWEDTVSFMKDTPGIPFIVTTNTELEAIADLQYLWDRGLIQRIPAGLMDMFEGTGSNHEDRDVNYDDDKEEEADEGVSFLSVNPYCGLRVRQNGTMANDVYVKSRWIFGGLTGSPHFSQKKAEGPPRKKSKSTSSKKSNPALV
jgi:hypothetical protein